MASRILLVEDEADLRHVMAIRLTAAGFLCDTARDGQEGLAKVKQFCPDLILADLRMPKMSGYDMITQLRMDPTTASIPVLVVTALPERMREQPISRLPGVYIARKPCTGEELVVTVRALLATPVTQGGPADGRSSKENPRGG